MISVVPFIPAHLEGFVIQEAQSLVNKYVMDTKYLQFINDCGDAYTYIADGEVQGVGGSIHTHPHLYMAWAFIGRDSGKHLFGMTKKIKDYLDGLGVQRIETAVKRDFKAGHRWANMLGFINETPETGMKNFDENGETHDLYARYG